MDLLKTLVSSPVSTYSIANLTVSHDRDFRVPARFQSIKISKKYTDFLAC